MTTTDPEVTTMICVASWYDSSDPHGRTASLELWMGSSSETSGTLYESRRPTPADVWEPAERVGIADSWSRTEAAAVAHARGLSCLVEYPHDAAAAAAAEASDAAVAALIVDALEALPADPRDALLELHGELVTIPGYREGDRPLLDSIITRLERRFMANRGEPGALAASQHASRRVPS